MAKVKNIPFLAIVLVALAAGYYFVGQGASHETQSEAGKYINGEYWVNAQLVTESVFENDMPWDFGGFGYQPIMRVVYEIPWDQIPEDVPYVWLNVTLPQEALTRINLIANKVSVDHNNPAWVSTVMPYQVVWAKRISIGNWEFYPIRSLMVAKTDNNGIPSEIHVQVDRDDSKQFLVVLIPTPYTISFEDMIGKLPSSGTFYGWTIEDAQNVYVRFAKDTVYTSGGNQYRLLNGGDNKVLFIDRNGYVTAMYKDINFVLSPSKKYPVAWSVKLAYKDPRGLNMGHVLIMIILDAETNQGSTKYIVFPIETVDQSGGSPNEEQEIQNYLGTTADYCLLPRQPTDAKFDLWEAVHNYCGADYHQLTKIKRIRIWAKSYGGVAAINYIMFGHPDFLNVTAQGP